MADQNNAPERIWILVADKTVVYAEPSDADYHEVEYIRADRAAPEGQVGALLEAEKRGMQKVLSHFRECAEHDQGGLDYSSLVGIPICNADELASEVAFYERAARHVQDVLDRADLARADRAAPTDNTALVEAQSEINRLKAALWSIGHAAGFETKDDLMLHALDTLAALAALASRKAPPAAPPPAPCCWRRSGR